MVADAKENKPRSFLKHASGSSSTQVLRVRSSLGRALFPNLLVRPSELLF
jgi:hypothetical protein